MRKMLPPYRHENQLEEKLELNPLPGGIQWSGGIAYLDRDGVLNMWSDNYVNSPEQVFLLPGAGKSVGSLRRSGFRVSVVTNQSPIGRGFWTHEDLALIHYRLQEMLLNEDEDAELDLILYSPYTPREGSWARKPNPGMLEAARQIFEIASNAGEDSRPLLFGSEWIDRPSEAGSFLVGDQDTDIQAAQSLGIKAIKCDTNLGISSVIDQILNQ
ncbi:MAG: hypothetical protein CMB67_02150 [Euryarchaeota archaeon]|nr:hypothetical protein [Euryarchaeota archaeon]